MSSLRPEDYGRLTIVIADCTECGAHRGEPCRSNATYRNGGLVVRHYGLGMCHTKRKDAAYTWRIHNRKKYLKLRDQIVARYNKEVITSSHNS